mmetsp:Transcript_16095/g.24315  ORF Transcript_16095/g.24315 Transcript_16095/m.24315 type:complete len:116 (-) Transcript_16095:157-504(-)
MLISSNNNFFALMTIETALQLLRMYLGPGFHAVMDLSLDGSEIPHQFFLFQQRMDDRDSNQSNPPAPYTMHSIYSLHQYYWPKGVVVINRGHLFGVNITGAILFSFSRLEPIKCT